MVKWLKYILGITILGALTSATAGALAKNTIEAEQIIIMLDWWDNIGSLWDTVSVSDAEPDWQAVTFSFDFDPINTVETQP